MGAVGCLKNVKNAIGVARSVMEQTGETLLVGDDGQCILITKPVFILAIYVRIYIYDIYI